MSKLMDKPSRRTTPLPDTERWLDALPLPMLGVDAGERIRFVNAAAAELLLLAGGRGLVGRRLDEVFGSHSTLSELVRRVIARGEKVSESELMIAEGNFAMGRVDVWAAPLEEGRFVALALAPRSRARPVGERSVSAVARTLAHEVRNPLAGIRAAAQLIGKNAGEESQPLTELICAEVDRIRRLTDRIDALEGLPPPRLARMNVHEPLDRVRRIIGSTFPAVAVRERYDPSLPHIRGDLDQLIQAFLNIAKNGAEAASAAKQGALTISTAYRPGVRIRSGISGAPRAQLEIAFEDNGGGIPHLIEKRLFEPFVTTKPNGMGLGLAVAAEVVGRHDGRIEAETAPGRTLFRVLLPIERLEGEE